MIISDVLVYAECVPLYCSLKRAYAEINWNRGLHINASWSYYMAIAIYVYKGS